MRWPHRKLRTPKLQSWDPLVAQHHLIGYSMGIALIVNQLALLPLTPSTALRVFPPPFTTTCWILCYFISILHVTLVRAKSSTKSHQNQVVSVQTRPEMKDMLCRSWNPLVAKASWFEKLLFLGLSIGYHTIHRLLSEKGHLTIYSHSQDFDS